MVQGRQRRGFDIALKGLKLALATLPSGLAIAAEAGLGIAQGLWKRTRGDATASVLGDLRRRAATGGRCPRRNSGSSVTGLNAQRALNRIRPSRSINRK